MNRLARGELRGASLGRLAIGVAASLWLGATVWGASFETRDGRTLEGKLVPVAGLAENPMAPNPNLSRSIYMIDNDLCRTFIQRNAVLKVQEGADAQPQERIAISQPVAGGNLRVARVGPIIRLDPFDEFGRRILTMTTERGPVNVIQGITLITPTWTKVESLSTKGAFQWDMRIATTSIPRAILSKILAKRVNREKLDDRLKVVRLYVQGERYQDAETELQEVIKDFPDQKPLEAFIRELHQFHARRILDEIKLRRNSGQHRLAMSLLQSFPADDVAGEILQEVRQLLAEYTEFEKQGAQVHAEIKANLDKVQDPAIKLRFAAIHKEIVTELNINTLSRMAAFLEFVNSPTMTPDQKISLAASGWLLGKDDANPNLAVSLSLVEVRNLVRQYLCESRAPERTELLKKLRSQEGTTPKTVAKLIEYMKPPHAAEAGDYFELSIPDIDKEPDVNYYVQLPPDYDPYRRYPTVVTLHGGSTTAQQQLDWWAGSPDANGRRVGQASRYGYIVIAVDWTKPDQQEYEFSSREHAAVLGCLRDACRRFSVDTDHVYLSGHAMGGDAAWDIALAHPDLWAGVIPIVARADKFCSLYWPNAKNVSFYFVTGELDGDKTVRNAKEWDKYLTKLGECDTTVVEYEGRGHEHFYDEIQRIFDWMGHRTRDFYPKNFKLVSERSWDNFYWWLEIRDYPAHLAVEPADWPPASGMHPQQVNGSIFPAINKINVVHAPGKVTIWLSPELVDFDQAVQITVLGKQLKTKGRLISPDLNVLLEDARTRADRQHPFWAKVEQP